MDITARRMLQEISVACPQYLRPEDWRRVYCFAVYLHTQNVILPRHGVRETLMQLGCSLQKASFLDAEVQHFSQLLRLYDEHRQPPSLAIP
jgi:hypothetical protein